MRRMGIILAMAAVATSARAQEAIPVTTVAAIKEATAFIRTSVESEQDGAAMTGSGFVIRSEGTTGYLVTNAHVVTPPKGENLFATRPTTRVHFRSGTKAESKASAEIVASDSTRDLAILKVSGVANLPKPIGMTADVEPFETMTVYIFGFPFGEKLSMGKGNPPVNVGRGQVSSIRRNENETLRAVLLDGALNPGNSGGPVVDAKGKLVGVARATIRGANIGFAIAVPELTAMLQGATEGANVAYKGQNQGAAEWSVEAPLLDPLDRVKSARLLYTTAEPKFSKTTRAVVVEEGAEAGEEKKPGVEEATFGPISGASTAPLTIRNQKAEGVIRFPTSQDVSLWCQVAHVDGAGKLVHSKPTRHLFGRPKPAEKGVPVAWGEVIDPDGDCRVRLEDGDLVGEVPGTLHDLNIDIGVNNAPRVVRGMAGDFVARVKVSGSFRPGQERTGPKSVPCNIGGIVAWLDSENYLRLERGAMYRNGRVVGFLNFEAREQGAKTEGHNRGGLDPKRDLWLKLERKGDTFSGALSDDGKEWDDLEPMTLAWPGKLKVGVDMINSSGDPMTVRFRGYSLAAPK